MRRRSTRRDRGKEHRSLFSSDEERERGRRGEMGYYTKGRNRDGGRRRREGRDFGAPGGATNAPDDGGASEKSGSARLANTGASRASSARGWEYFYLAEDSISRGVDARQGREESTRRRMTRRRARLRARLAGGPKSLCSSGPPRVVVEIFYVSREIFHVPLFFFTERGAPPRIARTRGVRGETRRGTRDAPSHARGFPSSREAFLAQVRARIRDARARFARRRIEIPGTVARETRDGLPHASASSSPASAGSGPRGPRRVADGVAPLEETRRAPLSRIAHAVAPRPPARRLVRLVAREIPS